MSNSVKKNYLFSLCYQAITFITPLITAPYVSRVLGADGIGVYSFADSVVTYFVLFAAMGTQVYGQREISYLQDDKARRSIVFWNTVALRLITAIAAGAMYVVFVLLCVEEGNRVLYLILLLNIVNVTLDVGWLLQGAEEFQVLAIRNIAVKILFVVFIFAVVKEKDDLLLYVLGITLSSTLSCLSIVPFLRKIVDPPTLGTIRPFADIKTVISLFVPTIAISVYTVLDKTMIGLITDDAFQNGYYEQALKISKMALSVLTTLGMVMAPRIGHLFARGDTKSVERYMYRSYRFVWLAGIPICLGLVGISSNFVPWFFGEGFKDVIPVLRVSSFIVIAIGVSNVTGIQYLIPTNRQHALTLAVTVGAVCNFALNLVLINVFQAVGAAIASVVAECIVSIVQLFVVRKELDMLIIGKSAAKYLLAGVLMLCIVLIVGSQLEASIVNTIILVALGVCVYGITLLALRDKFFIDCARSAVRSISNGSKG